MELFKYFQNQFSLSQCTLHLLLQDWLLNGVLGDSHFLDNQTNSVDKN